MNKKQNTILIFDDGSDAMNRYERLLADNGFGVKKINGNSLSEAVGHDRTSLLIARYGHGISSIIAEPFPVPVLLVLPDSPSADETWSCCVYGFLDDSSSDWVILNMVKRVIRERETHSLAQNEMFLASQMATETYKGLLDGMNESVWVIDFKGNLVDVNVKAEEMLGYSRSELMEKGLLGIDGMLKPEDISKSIISLKEDRIQVFETVHIGRDGRRIPVEVSSSIIRYHGKPAILSIARDIRERKDAEEQLREQLRKDELVVKAMHHRIKNNLATVANLLSLQAKVSGSGEVQEVLNEAVSRVQCIGLMYNKLLETSGYEGVSVETYFSGIVDSLLDIYPEKQSLSISFDMNDIVLEEKYLFPLGVIVEELFTNIFKYGFPDTPSGRISFTGIKEDSRIILKLTDDGCPMTNKGDGLNQKGFGMMIVNLLCKQIDAEYIQTVNGENSREIRFSIGV